MHDYSLVPGRRCAVGPNTGGGCMNYLDNIIHRLEQQIAKGKEKYGQTLEQNKASNLERLEHLAQELTDGLAYIEWIKEGLPKITFKEYQELAERTARRKPEDANQERYANFGMGLAGEAGEVCDYLKKVVFHGHELDKEKLAVELGDCLWYIATLANTAGISLEKVAEMNILKLKCRYPEGFSVDRSINRVEAEVVGDER